MENFRLCRICISESAVMMSIFGEDALWRKIVSFADVLIEEDDILPQQICMICVKNAINASEFKKKCEDADRYFRRQLQAEKVDIVVVSSDDEDTAFLPTAEEQMVDVKIFPLVTGDTPPPCPQVTNPVCSPKPPDTPTNPVLPVATFDSKSAKPEQPAAIEVSAKNAIKTSPNDKSIGHQCPICLDYFAVKSILKHHVKNKHPETEPTYECFDCKRLYNSQRFLEKHIRTGKCKKTEKQREKYTQLEFRCPTCGTSFPSGHHLGWHKRSGICAVFRIKRREKLAAISVRPLSTLTGNDNIKTQNGESSLTDNGDLPVTCPEPNTDQLKLDEDQLALARTLVLQNVNIKEMARQLNTSELCAIRLHKSMTGLYNRTNDKAVDMTENCSSEVSKSNNEIVRQSFDGTEDNDGSGYEQDTEMASSPRPGGSQSTKIRIKLFKGKGAEIVNNRSLQALEIKKSKIPLSMRKPRKPSVFMDEEKYERAKVIVGNNGTTTDLSQQLNISAMSAWKIRQCILKGVPLTFRKVPSPPRKRLTLPAKPVMKHGILKRPRLKGPDRIERDRQITKEILSLLNEDSTIQYWKMSDRLAEKGIHLTPPSICVKLKSMGIHRRRKENSNINISYDEPMIMNASASSKSVGSTSELILPANSTI